MALETTWRLFIHLQYLCFILVRAAVLDMEEDQPGAGCERTSNGVVLGEKFSNASGVVQNLHDQVMLTTYLKNGSPNTILKFHAFLEGMIRSKKTVRSRHWHVFPCRHAVAGFTCQIPEEAPVSLCHPRFVMVVQ